MDASEAQKQKSFFLCSFFGRGIWDSEKSICVPGGDIHIENESSLFTLSLSLSLLTHPQRIKKSKNTTDRRSPFPTELCNHNSPQPSLSICLFGLVSLEVTSPSHPWCCTTTLGIGLIFRHSSALVSLLSPPPPSPNHATSLCLHLIVRLQARHVYASCLMPHASPPSLLVTFVRVSLNTPARSK